MAFVHNAEFQTDNHEYIMLMIVGLILCTSDIKGKGSFNIAQYPVRWTAQSALHFLPPLTDMFIPTPTRLLREAV